MPDLNPIEQEASYAAGDPWRPVDANQFAVQSQDQCDVTLKNHTDEGTHEPDLNVAARYATVLYSGGSYSIVDGYGITAVNANGTGNLTLDIDAMLSADAYGVTIGPGPMDECVFGVRDLSGTNTGSKVTIQLFDNSRTAVDKSFGIAVWGVSA